MCPPFLQLGPGTCLQACNVLAVCVLCPLNPGKSDGGLQPEFNNKEMVFFPKLQKEHRYGKERVVLSEV